MPGETEKFLPDFFELFRSVEKKDPGRENIGFKLRQDFAEIIQDGACPGYSDVLLVVADSD